MKKYILALDEGTTSTRAILFDRAGQIVSTAQREFPSHYPQPGWVEQDAQEIYAAQYATLTESLVRCGAEMQEVAAIGITNQRETVVVWDRHTGKPLCPAIVWQCRRTADLCRKLEEDGLAPMIAEKTGLRPDAYFSATKLSWILDHVDGVRAAAEAGDALFGTVDTWLLWKLSGGLLHKTDATNASRTMLYNIHTQRWDDDLLRAMNRRGSSVDIRRGLRLARERGFMLRTSIIVAAITAMYALAYLPWALRDKKEKERTDR